MLCITFYSSPLKPLGQMNRNFVGSIYGRSSIELPIAAMEILYRLSGFRGEDFF
jgi:hypothetical protein